MHQLDLPYIQLGSIYVLKVWLRGCPEHVSKIVEGEISIIGYGRDAEEACNHAGRGYIDDGTSLFRWVRVSSNPSQGDIHSKKICNAICSYHLEDDPYIPEEEKSELRRLIKMKLYAEAVDYCFHRIWDGEFYTKSI